MESERIMPLGELIQSNGVWGLLGSALTMIGLFALGMVKVLTGKEIGFRRDLLQRVQDLEVAIREQRKYYEQKMKEMDESHCRQIAQIKEEYHRDLKSFMDRERDDGK